MTGERQCLSVVIGVYNEADKIARCLDSLGWADEIVLMDKFSTDATVDICRKYANVAVVQREDELNANVNYGTEQAKGPWILHLDADEIPSPELVREIQDDVLANPSVEYDGFWVPNRVFFFGKWIRYGVAYDARFGKDRVGYGFRQRLFRKGFAWYECKRLHEPISTRGRWGLLKSHYDHFSHATISGWIAKMNNYTDRDVRLIDVLDRGFRPARPKRTVVALMKVFYDLYVKRRGYKDGLIGFIVCALNTAYILVERCKVWEKYYRITHASEIVEY